MFIPTKAQAEAVSAQFGTPAFVTDRPTLEANAKKLTEAFSGFNVKVFYAMKANYNPAIMKVLKAAGVYGVDAVASNEVLFALEQGYQPDEIIFTPSNPGTDVIKKVGELGVMQNLGSLSEITRFCELFPGGEVSIRVSPGIGAGEFDQIATGGIETKFGLIMSDLEAAKQICDQAGVTIIGIHSHIGSGFYEASVLRHYVETILSLVKDYPTVKVVDFGGGFGVQYKPGGKEIDLDEFATAMRTPIEAFESETGRTLEYRIEPGKFLVSSSTVLLAEVTTVKQKGTIRFIGLNTGFHHLIRPAMYGAYQHVVNATRPEAEMVLVDVAGNVCETCDLFATQMEVADPHEGDLLAILVAGGYGSAMSSNYNMRGTAVEVMIDGDECTLTKKAQSLADITRLFV